MNLTMANLTNLGNFLSFCIHWKAGVKRDPTCVSSGLVGVQR